MSSTHECHSGYENVYEERERKQKSEARNCFWFMTFISHQTIFMFTSSFRSTMKKMFCCYFYNITEIVVNENGDNVAQYKWAFFYSLLNPIRHLVTFIWKSKSFFIQMHNAERLSLCSHVAVHWKSISEMFSE
jgi:hypothetical protein